jgi:hypothetical protein
LLKNNDEGLIAIPQSTEIKKDVMKKFLIISILAINYFTTNAQHTFQKTYGGTAMDNGNSVRQTFDGGYIVVGTTTSFGSGGGDVLAIKTNELGDTSWTKTFGGASDNEYGFCVQQTTDSGYIISGVASSFDDVAGDIYIIKLNASGDTIWTRTYGGIGYEWGAYLQQTTDGGYIIAGQTPAFGAGGFDAYLIKIDVAGNLSWTKTYGGSGLEIGSAVQQTTDGGYILSGQIDSYGAGSTDFYLVKTDSTGNVVWAKAYGTPGSESGVTVKQTSDGGYIIGGTSENAIGPLGPDMCLIKTDSIGDTLWTKLYGGPMIDECYEVVQTTDGGYMMCGKSFSFSTAGDYDVYIVKTDGQGIVQWSRSFGDSGSGSKNDIGNSIFQTNDGGYIIVGESMYGFGIGLKNIYLIKTDSLGNSGCNQGYPATATSIFSPLFMSPPTLTSSGGTISFPVTMVNSGGIPTTNCLSTEVVENTSDVYIALYPNPFSTTITFEFYLDEIKNASISIVDMIGNVVKNVQASALQPENNKITIDLSKLSSGIYFCQFRYGGKIQTIKLVKK